MKQGTFVEGAKKYNHALRNEMHASGTFRTERRNTPFTKPFTNFPPHHNL
jgi:hypothetical protein